MKKLTRETLEKMRLSLAQPMSMRDIDGKDTQIIVGMATCGIVAGAKDVFNAFVEELAAQGIMNVLIRQTGCMSLCQHEPTVEVIAPDMPVVTYGKVTAKLARDIVRKHIVGKTLIEANICDKQLVR